VGGFESTDDAGGGVVGATALVRYGPAAAGGLAEGGGALFGYSYSGVAALAGLSLHPVSRVRFELLGAYGVHSYSGVGRGFLSDDPGVDGSTPYAGVRAGGGYLFGTRATRLQLGLVAALDHDLSRKTVSYQYTDTSWFGTDSNTQDAEQTIGTRRTSILFTVGALIDL
jgi:hypothetical protein